MCGFFGLVSKDSINLEKARESLEILNHRGPDNSS